MRAAPALWIALASAFPAAAQTRADAREAVAETGSLAEVARGLGDESPGEELSAYVEKKLGFVEGQRQILISWTESFAEDDREGFQRILDISDVHATILKQIIALSNAYIRTEYLLERNLEAVERAEEMVDPGNYPGLNQVNAARHFYQVHAVELGMDKQKAKMAAESPSQPVDGGGALAAAVDNSNRSMEFVQKAMAVARDETGARRFLELAERVLESLEEQEGTDPGFLEEAREEFARAEETYSVHNFALAARQFEDLLKRLGPEAARRAEAKASGAAPAAARPKPRVRVRPEFQLRAGSSYLTSSNADLDAETRNILRQDTVGGDSIRLFDAAREKPWTHFTGLNAKVALPVALGVLHAENYGEYSSYGLSDLLSLRLAGRRQTLSASGEIRDNRMFPANSFTRGQLRWRGKVPLPGESWRWEGEIGGGATRYYRHDPSSNPSHQGLRLKTGLARSFGFAHEAGAGLSGEWRQYADSRRSFRVVGLPLSLRSAFRERFSLLWEAAPQYRDYLDTGISDRATALSYGILSYSLNPSVTLSFINDLEYLLYADRPSEFRKDRLSQISTLRLGYARGPLNLSAEYSLDYIGNRNALDDSLYAFNLNENQWKNRLGLNAYYVLSRSLRHSSKISLGMSPGLVRHTHAEDAFYRNMVLGQTYASYSQAWGRAGFDLSLTYDGGWDSKTFSLGGADRLRDNLFAGVNVYVNH